MEEPDVHLYTHAPEHYDAVQMRRPDYRGAIETSLSFAHSFLATQERVSIVDYGGGPGGNIQRLIDELPIERATIIDINERFLAMAHARLGKLVHLQTIHGDASLVSAGLHHTMALSLFVYHHLEDAAKATYLQQLYAALAPGYPVIVAEIYVPDRASTLRYYEELIAAIPENDSTDELVTFLHQTARSENFEYKVSKARADADFAHACLIKCHEVRIWPNDSRFPPDIGTFVQVYIKPALAT